jgi:hypothetical protein
MVNQGWIYRSRRIDCVVLELSLPDHLGFQTLVESVPIARRPQVAGDYTHPHDTLSCVGVSQANRDVCVLGKKITSGEDLYKEIQRAIEFVRLMRKEERTAWCLLVCPDSDR